MNFLIFFCREREQTWADGGAAAPIKEGYDGPAGMDPDGVIESSWNQVRRERIDLLFKEGIAGAG